MKAEAPILLLVEEDELLADITAFRLELLGYTALCMRSAKDALQRLAQDPLPSILIVDTTLPDINGLELIEKLNAEERTHNIPIIALSVEADLDWVQRAHRAGAKDCLILPCDPAVLEQKVEKMVAKVVAAEKEETKGTKSKKAANN